MLQKEKSTIIPLIIAVFIIAIFVSFIGGMYYGKSANLQTKPNTLERGSNQFSQNGIRPNGFGRTLEDRPLLGEVTMIVEKTITMTIKGDASNKTIVVADNTNITDNGADATLANIKVGDNLIVIGQTNSDGSIKAQMIKINQTTNNSADASSPQ